MLTRAVVGSAMLRAEAAQRGVKVISGLDPGAGVLTRC